MLFVFLVSLTYLFDSDCHISFDPMQIKSMTLESSTLQIRRHEYSRYLNIVICVGFSTLPFYAINMDDVSLFTDSSFLFLANFHCIDVLYQFE
ncbi:transmembrane protein, putative [Medicago truncatula]|uniref:Transmembrane protein, putative n=1 Tax=Medicago truncatula TaxID=3880 RepID=G7IRN9_MEDTR|nr:transmembrane protein, putative [Medicago truncatula]